jgi:hypothetical protein
MNADLLELLVIIDDAFRTMSVPQSVVAPKITWRDGVELHLKIYVYASILYLRGIFKAVRRDAEEGNDPATWLLTRSICEWAAAFTYVNEKVQAAIKADDWSAAFDVLFVVLQGNRWVKKYGMQQGGDQDLVDHVPTTTLVRELIETYHKAVREGIGQTDTREGYSRMSEHCHPGSACLMPYILWPTAIDGEQVDYAAPIRFSETPKPGRGEKGFEFGRSLVALPLLLYDLLGLAEEQVVRKQVRELIEKLAATQKKNGSKG